MHESEKWKWSRSVVSNSSRPHGLQPTRLLCSSAVFKQLAFNIALLVFQLPQFFVVWDCFAYCSSFTMPWHYSLNANSSPCTYSWGFPNGSVVNICQQYKRHRTHGFDSRVGKIPWRRKWQCILTWKIPQRILVGYSLKGWKGLDATVWLSMCLFPNTPRVLDPPWMKTVQPVFYFLCRVYHRTLYSILFWNPDSLCKKTIPCVKTKITTPT